MMIVQTLFEQVFILLVVIVIGYIAAKKRMLSGEIQSGLSNILLNITIPATVIVSGNYKYSDDIIPNMMQIGIISMIFYLGFIIVANVCAGFLKLESAVKKGFISSVVFANVAFIGYPFAEALFGQEGVLYTSVTLLVFSVFMWTYGIYLFSGDKKIDLLKFINPCTISTLIMIVIFVGQINIPKVIFNSLDLLSGVTVPLSMILIGAAISKIKITTLFDDKISLVVAFLRLLFFPILFFFILKLFNINETVSKICITLSALPCGSLNIILAQRYNCNPAFVSRTTFVSMILFLFTMPVVLYLLYA